MIMIMNLKSGFNDVGRGDEGSGRHTGYGTGYQQRQGGIVAVLIRQSRFGVRVRREVNGAERHVAKEASFGTLKPINSYLVIIN